MPNITLFVCVTCSQSITPKRNKFQGHSAMRYRNICFTKAHGHLRRCNASIQAWGSRWVILMTRKVTSFAHFIKSRAQLAFKVLKSFSACYLLYVVTPCGPTPCSLNVLLGESNERTRQKQCCMSSRPFRLLSIISGGHVHDGGHRLCHTCHSDSLAEDWGWTWQTCSLKNKIVWTKIYTHSHFYS